MLIIKGAGDLASGVAVRLFRSGYKHLLMTDLPSPTAIRRTVSFCTAITNGTAQVEDIAACRADSMEDVKRIWSQNAIAVLADPACACLSQCQPQALIDAVLAKRCIGTSIIQAPLVIALGPGFMAGADCHVVIETSRGHDLGRAYDRGSAQPNTGIPGNIGGYTTQRILRAPCEGKFHALGKIGDMVQAGDVLATVEGQPITAQIDGVLRGILTHGCMVHRGMKSGDIDPRGNPAHCFTVSDKARSLGGTVLEVLLQHHIFPDDSTV